MQAKEILIVDEQFPMLDHIQRILQDWGYTVTLAPDARLAQHELAGHHFDLILVSLNGYEKEKLNLLRRARKMSSRSRLMVVGYAKVTLPMEVFQIRVEDYILPPFTARELSTRVDRCLKDHEIIAESSENGAEHIGSVVNTFKQEILSIHNSLLSLKGNFDAYVDREINMLNNGSIDKIYGISHELNFLITITESILHNMLTCYNGKKSCSMGKIFPQDFFKQTKINQLH